MKLPFRLICEILIAPDESGDPFKVEAKLRYVCDGEACETCHAECHLTSDIHHARRFKLGEDVVLHG